LEVLQIKMKKIDIKLLRTAQLKMLGILVEIDKVCRQHDIEYWLDAGTLLGAYRHKGFIPWDDDIDISMKRKDFEKFLSIAQNSLPKDLFVQTPHTDSAYYKRTLPCKVRCDNTYIKEAEDENFPDTYKQSHNGLFVDIFPVDLYSRSKLMRKVERLFASFYYLKTISIYKNNKSITRNILSKLMKLVPWAFLEKFRELLSDSMNQRAGKRLLGFGVEVPLDLGFTDEKDLFPLVEIEFEGYNFFAPKNQEIWLETRYGSNYMQLPPEDKRVWHAVEIHLE
jgi:lipopolysaccharide cholinephosphotransferase